MTSAPATGGVPVAVGAPVKLKHDNSTANVNQTGGHLAITPLPHWYHPVTGWTSGRTKPRTDFQPPAGGRDGD